MKLKTIKFNILIFFDNQFFEIWLVDIFKRTLNETTICNMKGATHSDYKPQKIGYNSEALGIF